MFFLFLFLFLFFVFFQTDIVSISPFVSEGTKPSKAHRILCDFENGIFCTYFKLAILQKFC